MDIVFALLSSVFVAGSVAAAMKLEATLPHHERDGTG